MTTATTLAPELGELVTAMDVDLDGLCVTTPTETLHADSARDLRQMLSSHIYASHHIRRPSQDGEDSSFSRDPEFERRLGARTPHRWSRYRAPVVGPGTARRLLIDGVRVTVADSELVSDDGATCTVRVPAARPVLSPGFFLVDASRGRFPGRAGLTRLYLSIEDRAAAPEVWSQVLTALESTGIGYRAKIGSSERTYPRTDAMVVYVSRADPAVAEHVGRVEDVVTRVLPESLPLSDSTSVFTRRLRPGLAIADEPADPRPGMRGMSFGEHRAYAVATGLLSAPDDAVAGVVGALAAAGVDPADTSRNLDPTQPATPATA